MIPGGYILQPRIIQESDISVAPPYVREIWNYLLREANSQDVKYNGYELKRGQLFRSYEDIREGTKWFVGWRKCTYNENHTKKAMKFLRDTGRITTTKELGGVLITINKYDYYQDPKNYERTAKVSKERTIGEPLQNQPIPYNNKNERKKRIYIVANENDSFNFYASQVEKAKTFTDQMSKDYVTLARHICKKDKEGMWELPYVLQIEKQISLDDFAKLYEKSNRNLDTIIAKIDSIQNKVKYHNEYSDLYRTINGWIINDHSR